VASFTVDHQQEMQVGVSVCGGYCPELDDSSRSIPNVPTTNLSQWKGSRETKLSRCANIVCLRGTTPVLFWRQQRIVRFPAQTSPAGNGRPLKTASINSRTMYIIAVSQGVAFDPASPCAKVVIRLFGCFGLLCASICCAADARSSPAAPHVDSDKMAMVEEKKLPRKRQA
jgi:hypothetical protein